MGVIEVCKHGRVISRCRCPGPHPERRVSCLPDCPPGDYEPRHAAER